MIFAKVFDGLFGEEEKGLSSQHTIHLDGQGPKECEPRYPDICPGSESPSKWFLVG
ncbi:hypothetical protein ACYOEI_19790 [Singulisphaera rosea]